MIETPTIPPPSSADAFRQKYAGDITVTLPNGLTILCRRPDMDDAIFRSVLPLPVLRAFVTELAGVARAADTKDTKTLNQQVEAFFESGAAGTAATVDIWVCLAARSPRIVATEAQAGPDALWVREIPLAHRLEIFTATFSWGEAARQAAALAFRSQPGRAATGSGGAPVSDAPLVDVEHR